MEIKQLVIKSLFEDDLKSNSLYKSYILFQKDYKPVSSKEAEFILSKCKIAFYKRKSMKDVQIFSKYVNIHGRATYAAIVPPSFFMEDNPIICQVDFYDDNDMLLISFVNTFTGGIIQGKKGI